MKVFILLAVFGIGSVLGGGKFFLKSDYYRAMGWCVHGGSRLHIGDFNGDGRSDMMCHDHSGSIWVSLADGNGHFTKTSWHNKNFKWCGHPGSKLYTGDFNGDGRSDILCHDHVGSVWTSLATSGGSFTGSSWNRAKWFCGHQGSELHIGDFNGDGRSDILCHDHSGNKWISYAQSNGGFNNKIDWHKAMGWCYHQGSQLLIADINGDGRDDLLCHDANGYKWVALANCHGQFTTTSWQKGMNWCVGKNAFLMTGRFNDDARADLFCHQSHSGMNWIALARHDVHNLFTGTDWTNFKWCGMTGEVYSGDFNGDGKDDILCHEPHSGKKWISFNRHQI
ncbi:uncharacterized protein LOC5515387 [Nematostella vectensis]|uniref:uncharacterized protein LOC5515387 n=1 Tax=Nematostella vectensis TaxID=45351 RepID=UPI0020775BD4|nr:uncharacterized protein LOC5515387 [Nematostella vectensis]